MPPFLLSSLSRRTLSLVRSTLRRGPCARLGGAAASAQLYVAALARRRGVPGPAVWRGPGSGARRPRPSITARPRLGGADPGQRHGPDATARTLGGGTTRMRRFGSQAAPVPIPWPLRIWPQPHRRRFPSPGRSASGPRPSGRFVSLSNPVNLALISVFMLQI